MELPATELSVILVSGLRAEKLPWTAAVRRQTTALETAGRSKVLSNTIAWFRRHLGLQYTEGYDSATSPFPLDNRRGPLITSSERVRYLVRSDAHYFGYGSKETAFCKVGFSPC